MRARGSRRDGHLRRGAASRLAGPPGLRPAAGGRRPRPGPVCPLVIGRPRGRVAANAPGTGRRQRGRCARKPTRKGQGPISRRAIALAAPASAPPPPPPQPPAPWSTPWRPRGLEMEEPSPDLRQHPFGAETPHDQTTRRAPYAVVGGCLGLAAVAGVASTKTRTSSGERLSSYPRGGPSHGCAMIDDVLSCVQPRRGRRLAALTRHGRPVVLRRRFWSHRRAPSRVVGVLVYVSMETFYTSAARRT